MLNILDRWVTMNRVMISEVETKKGKKKELRRYGKMRRMQL